MIKKKKISILFEIKVCDFNFCITCYESDKNCISCAGNRVGGNYSECKCPF